MKKWKRGLAYVLCMVMLLEGTSIQVLAEKTDLSEKNKVEATAEIATQKATTDGNDAIVDAGTTDGEDMVIVASGKYCEGVTWTLTKGGLLTVEGTANASLGAEDTNYTRGWMEYKDAIITAKLSANGIKNFNYFLADCKNLKSADFINSDMSSAVTVKYMFQNCSSLIYLDLSNLDWRNVEDIEMWTVLEGCSSLQELISPKYTGDWRLYFPHIMYDGTKTEYDHLAKNQTFPLHFWKDADKVQIKSDDIIYSGAYCDGITWYVTYDGLLVVEGAASGPVTNGDEGWLFWPSAPEKIKRARVNVQGIGSFEKFFQGCENMETVDFTGTDSSHVTSMYEMFLFCKSLKSITFPNADTSSVTDMSEAFWGCESLSNLDVSSWDTSSVTNMNSMFYDCSGLVTLDLSSFNTAKVENMEYMFYNCSGLKELNLSSFDTSQVQKMNSMFYNCDGLTGLDVIDDFEFNSVTDMSNAFANCDGIISVDFSKFYFHKLENMNAMFAGCSNLTSAKMSNLTTDTVTDMESLFALCSSLKDVDFQGFNTSRVMDMDYMFYECDSLEYIDLNPLETYTVFYMEYMFAGCYNLTTVKWEEIDTGKLSCASHLFEGCLKLKNIDFIHFETDDVFWMDYMFADCQSLETLDLSNFNTGETCYMQGMFSGCSGLKYVDVSSFDTRQVEDMDWMFAGCSSLQRLDLSNFDGSAVGDLGSGMINDCTSLIWVKTPVNFAAWCEVPNGAMYDKNGKVYKNFPRNSETSVQLWSNKQIRTDTSVVKIEPIADQVYCGKAIKPEVTVTFGDKVLVPGKDYAVSYKNTTNAAFAADNVKKAPTVTVRGKGNYTAALSATFNIIAKEINSDNTVINGGLVWEENGKVREAKPVVTVDGVKLKANKDYVVHYPEKAEGAYQNAGCYKVVITGRNNYSGTVETEMVILGKNQANAAKLKIGKLETYTYQEGIVAEPTPEVVWNRQVLVLGRDYSLSYEKNDCAGKAVMILTGLENTAEDAVYVYGTTRKTFVIQGTALSKAKVNYNTKATFSGNAICPEVTLEVNGAALKQGQDYKVRYLNNVNAGKATIILDGCGGYTGTLKKTFVIQALQLTEEQLNVGFTEGKNVFSYTQKGVKPEVEVAVGDVRLVAGKDYTISYQNNRKVMDASGDKAPTVVVKGKGNYKFTKKVTFSIVEKNLADLDVNVMAPDVFLGKKLKIMTKPIVTDENGKMLKSGKDYRIVGYYVAGLELDGTEELTVDTVITVKIEGIGNYKGIKEAEYRIAERDIAKQTIKIQKMEYNGDAVEFTEEMFAVNLIKITDKESGKKLMPGRDFVVTGYSNNQRKGTATVTIQGVGKYGGSKTVKFSIGSKSLSNIFK